MNKLKIIILQAAVIFISSGCGDDSTGPQNTEEENNNYVKVVSSESGNIRFEVWSATTNVLRVSYNKIGFKVFENNQEKTSGFVKYFPKMYHWLGSPMHSTPVKSQFNYVDSLHLFAGYAIYIMNSDTSSFWYGFYNYNNQFNLDSGMFNVSAYPEGQFRSFVDNQASLLYLITLVKPNVPVQGFNTFQCMLHSTHDDISYQQVDNAQMQIMPWMESMGHGSTNNIHPVHIGDGIYEGQINLNMPGEWNVADSVYLDGRKITEGIPPKFKFNP